MKDYSRGSVGAAMKNHTCPQDSEGLCDDCPCHTPRTTLEEPAVKNGLVGRLDGYRLHGKSYDANGVEFEETHEANCLCCRKELFKPQTTPSAAQRRDSIEHEVRGLLEGMGWEYDHGGEQQCQDIIAYVRSTRTEAYEEGRYDEAQACVHNKTYAEGYEEGIRDALAMLPEKWEHTHETNYDKASHHNLALDKARTAITTLLGKETAP